MEISKTTRSEVKKLTSHGSWWKYNKTNNCWSTEVEFGFSRVNRKTAESLVILPFSPNVYWIIEFWHPEVIKAMEACVGFLKGDQYNIPYFKELQDYSISMDTPNKEKESWYIGPSKRVKSA